MIDYSFRIHTVIGGPLKVVINHILTRQNTRDFLAFQRLSKTDRFLVQFLGTGFVNEVASNRIKNVILEISDCSTEPIGMNFRILGVDNATLDLVFRNCWKT